MKKRRKSGLALSSVSQESLPAVDVDLRQIQSGSVPDALKNVVLDGVGYCLVCGGKALAIAFSLGDVEFDINAVIVGRDPQSLLSDLVHEDCLNVWERVVLGR